MPVVPDFIIPDVGNVAFADLSKSAVVSLSIEESLELTRGTATLFQI